MQKGKFNILVDAAWGSSGKGAVAARLADIYSPENLSSNNYPNAGHTVNISRCVDNLTIQDVKFTFKVLPSGAAVAWMKKEYNPTLWLGPTSGFWFDQYVREVKDVGMLEHQVVCHPRAVVMHERHPQMEAPDGKESTEHISSTMSGAGAAFTEKLMRKKGVTLARSFFGTEHAHNGHFYNIFRNQLNNGRTFLHEVSQGYALSVNHGTHYPHCTFRDCTPQQAMADFMAHPSDVGDVYLNIRSFPIRVGNNFRDGEQTGYSGDFYPDQREVSWQEVGFGAEMPLDEVAQLAEREKTTVTKKIRRVATQSLMLCQEAAQRCGATKLVLNFPQYIHWSAHKQTGGKEALQKLHRKVREHIDALEAACNLPVIMLGTGAHHNDYIFLEG